MKTPPASGLCNYILRFRRLWSDQTPWCRAAVVEPRQRVEVEVDQRLSVVIPGLEEIDAIVRDEVDHPVLLGQASRPDVRAQMPEGLRLAEPGEWVSQDGFNERGDLESDTSIVFDPVPKVFSELVLKNAVPTSRDDDGRPP
jgi:hypothetical protein